MTQESLQIPIQQIYTVFVVPLYLIAIQLILTNSSIGSQK